MVMGDMAMRTDLLVIGGGPGGYSAAFRAADLGLEVTLVDPRPQLGGSCLHTGCIPSKTLLHIARFLGDSKRVARMGIRFRPPEIDLPAMRDWQHQVIGNMADNLMDLARQRGIMLVRGQARFVDSTTVRLTGAEMSSITFKRAVIAIGSSPRTLPGFNFSPGSRVMDPAAALAVTEIPDSLLVVGGGCVGVEIGTIYAALGSSVTLVEMHGQLLKNIDGDLTLPLQKRLEEDFASVELATRVDGIDEGQGGVTAHCSQRGDTVRLVADRMVLAIGRTPRSGEVGLEHAGVRLDSGGFIITDDQQRTTVPHIFAVGDVTGGAMLAHQAARQGRVAAEVICGRQSAFDVRVIPAVVYTEPQIAWCGLSEKTARLNNIAHTVLRFPWQFSDRAQTQDSPGGFTKLLTHPDDGRILGVGMTGRNCESLIGEAALAIEMGSLAEDLALVLHPYPTLAETVGGAAELFLGSSSRVKDQGSS